MLRNMSPRLLYAVLAVTVALPFGLVVTAKTASANSSCYYSSYKYDTVYGSYAGSSIKSTVQYTLGYTCSGVPNQIDVSWFQDSITFLRCTAPCVSGYHETRQGYLCNPYQDYGWYCSRAWTHTSTLSCNSQYAACTITRNEYPNIWMAYYPGSSTGSYWNYTGSYGGNWQCNIVHSFNAHHLYTDCVGGP